MTNIAFSYNADVQGRSQKCTIKDRVRKSPRASTEAAAKLLRMWTPQEHEKNNKYASILCNAEVSMAKKSFDDEGHGSLCLYAPAGM